MTQTRTRAALALLIFLAAAFVYGITPNKIFSFDSITNAIACERNEPIRWFHPNHPLYPAIGVAYYRIERMLGFEGFAIDSLARLNSLLMAAALALLSLGLARKTHLKTALLAAAFLGSTYGIWHFAVDGRAVGASVFFAVLVILQLLELDNDRPIHQRETLTLALLSTLYVLAHGIAIFHVLAVIAWLAVWKRDRSAAVVYSTVVWMALLVVYGAIYFGVARHEVSEPFFRWATGYASYDGSHMPGYTGFWSTSIGSALRGVWAGWRGLFLGHTVTPSQLILSAGLAVGFPGVLAAASMSQRKSLRTQHGLAAALILWGILCEFFVAFWSPGQIGFHLHALLPWTVALALLTTPSSGRLLAVGLVSVTLFLLNLRGPISHAATLSNNKGYMTLSAVREHLSLGDTFATALAGSVPEAGVLMPYFFPELSGGSLEGRLFAFRETSLLPLEMSWRKHLAQGEKIYLLDDFLDPAVQRMIEARFGLPAGDLQKLMSHFGWHFAFELPDGRKVLRLSPST